MKDYKTTIYEHNGEDRLTIDFEEKEIVLSCRDRMEDKHLQAMMNAIDGVIYIRNEAITEE
jgi:hypothetical protein